MDGDTHILESQMALHEQGTVFEVTLAILAATEYVDDLMRRAAQTIVERHRYDHIAIYLTQPGTPGLRLAVVESTGAIPHETFISLARAATSESRSLIERHGNRWRVAVPIEPGSHILGVLVVGSDTSSTRADRARILCRALAVQLSLGIQNSDLRRQQLEVVADQERARIAHEIHDGVAQTMYALNLGLENCARLAQREDSPRLSESLSSLVPLSRQTLLEIRHYIYDLAPLLSGEDSFGDLLEKQVGEFEAISEIPTHLDIRGDSRCIPVPVRAGIYRILHEALSNVLQHSQASEVRVVLEVGSASLLMVVQDNGVGFNEREVGPGYGLDSMRRRVEEIGGTFDITGSEGSGTDLTVHLPVS